MMDFVLQERCPPAVASRFEPRETNMPSYIPEHVYGMMPWPKVLQPRPQSATGGRGESLAEIGCPTPADVVPLPGALSSGVELTKKGEAYAAAATAADGVMFLTINSRDRVSIATTIERLIDMLDAIDGDPDLEPYLAGTYPETEDREGDTSDDEATLGWGQGTQAALHVDTHNEAEEEDEHGGDINDEPHDWNELEPMLGWNETCGQGEDPDVQHLDQTPDPNDIDVFEGEGRRPLQFDGTGYRKTQDVLRDLRRRRPDVHQEYVRVMPGYGW